MTQSWISRTTKLFRGQSPAARGIPPNAQVKGESQSRRRDWCPILSLSGELAQIATHPAKPAARAASEGVVVVAKALGPTFYVLA